MINRIKGIAHAKAKPAAPDGRHLGQ